LLFSFFRLSTDPIFAYSRCSTITQRFILPLEGGKEGETCEVDVDADCRLCFFVEKKEDGWKNHFFKGEFLFPSLPFSASLPSSPSTSF
jgi:hypothetical protein